MPTPSQNETRDEWMERCIPVVLDEGTADDNDQAVAICSSMWDEHMKDKHIQRLKVSLEIKALHDREFEGHGSVFGNVDLGGDIVMPGAFKRSLTSYRKAGKWPQMFWMHDPSRVPGKWLDMHEDDTGLAVKGVYAPTDLGDEIHTLTKMDAVRGLSIGYVTKDRDFDDDGNRLIKEAELWEVSIVSLPMNPLAEIAHVKSRLSAQGEYVPTARELEHHLRDVGCSQKVAKRMVAKLFSDDSSATLDSQHRDDEADPITEAMNGLADRMLAALIEDRMKRIA